MNIPYWLLRLLPMWIYVCPACRKEVRQNSHKCPHCGEKYPLTLRVPPTFLKDPKKLEAYVHKHVFSRVSEFERNYLTQYFTTFFSDGWETAQDFTTNWTNSSVSAGCTIEVQNTNPHHGTYNAHALTTATSSVTAYCYKTGVFGAITYARMYVKFNQINTLLNIRIHLLDLVGTTYVSAQLRNSPSVWAIRVGASNYLGANTPVTGQWYCVDLMRDNTNDLVQLWVDGVVEVASTAVAITGDCTQINTGITASSVSAVNELYFDCVVVADAYIGPESSYSPSTRSSLPNTMTTMLNSKMLFS